MNLTDNEKRDAIRLIQAGKPLPDRYRFLLFDDDREVELVWNGKTAEVSNVVLPFQVIEQVDEPRSEEVMKQRFPLFEAAGISLDGRGRQLKGWTNKLIWGDNKLILSSLKNGPLREEIEKEGGIKLIYIDPPFDVGADFSMDIEIGGDTFTKKRNILEELAYRDTWGRGADSYIAMIYERLMLMRDLLAEDGSIYVHCDWRVNGHLRQVLDEVFGNNNFLNEIVWKRSAIATGVKTQWRNSHDVLLFYSKSHDNIFHVQYGEYSESSKEHYRNKDEHGTFRTVPLMASGRTSGLSGQPWKGIDPGSRGRDGMHWLKKPDILEELDQAGLILWNSQGIPELKYYLSEAKGVYIPDFWDDINVINSMAKESVGYATQKPEALLERIIKASSDGSSIVADFFCGSGTTAAVAEKLGRKWIVSDLGKFAIHTTRKRMIGVQRELKKEDKDWRAFEILNLGKYERQHYIGVNTNLREEEKQKQLEAKEKHFLELILHAYRAESADNFRCFHGRKAGRMVAVGPVNLPVTRLFVEEIILECREKRISRVDILGFEFEMGLFPNILDEAKAKGIDLAMKYIPADVFDKRAVERNQVVFHDVSYIEVKPHVKKNSIAVELTDFSVFYSQDSIDNVAENLKNGSNSIVVEQGQIVKVSKNKQGIVTREVLTRNWTDWIDYWSVDFDFENKREIIAITNEETGEVEEYWTGDFVFENEWQSFRTKKDRSLELKTPFRECDPGRYKIAVKVVDIFGNDTMKIVEVNVN